MVKNITNTRLHKVNKDRERERRRVREGEREAAWESEHAYKAQLKLFGILINLGSESK